MDTRKVMESFKSANEKNTLLFAAASAVELLGGLYLIANAQNTKSALIGASFAGGGLRGTKYSFETSEKDFTTKNFVMNTTCGAVSKIINGACIFYTDKMNIVSKTILNSLGGFLAELASEGIESLFALENKFRKKDLLEATVFGTFHTIINYKIAPYTAKQIIDGASNARINMWISGLTNAFSGGLAGATAKVTANLIERKKAIMSDVSTAIISNAVNGAATGVIDGYRGSHAAFFNNNNTSSQIASAGFDNGPSPKI